MRPGFEDRYGMAADVRSWLYADAWVRGDAQQQFRGLPAPTHRFYYRRPKGFPYGEPGLYLPISCAIAFDAATDGGTAATATTLSFNHTCTGANGGFFVAIQGEQFGSGADPTSVLYNSVAMSQLDKRADGNVATNCYLYGLLGPATGSHSCAITFASSTTRISAAGASYTGVKTSGLPDAHGNAGVGSPNTAQTTTLTSVADNCFGLLASTSQTAAGTGSTLRAANSTNVGIFDNGAAKTPAGAFTMQTTNAGAVFVAHAWATIAPDTGAGGGVTLPELERFLRGLTRGLVH